MNKTLEEFPDGSAAIEVSTVPKDDILALQEDGKTYKPALVIALPGCEHRHRSPDKAFICGVKVLSAWRRSA